MDKKCKYIDIHTHILPGVDDGSPNMEETVRMLKQAYEQDIRTIIATPHFIAGKNNMPVEQLRIIRDRVQEEAYKLDSEFEILLGNELYYSDSVIAELQAGRALTLAGSSYVLVEFNIGVSYDKLIKAIGELYRTGYIPVLAHAERYLCLYHKEYMYSSLVDSGCYIQMNADSLKGGIFNSDAAFNLKMVKRQLVHFIGSDCHDADRRKPAIMTAVKALGKKCDEELINRICIDNPAKVTVNSYI